MNAALDGLGTGQGCGCYFLRLVAAYWGLVLSKGAINKGPAILTYFLMSLSSNYRRGGGSLPGPGPGGTRGGALAIR